MSSYYSFRVLFWADIYVYLWEIIIAFYNAVINGIPSSLPTNQASIGLLKNVMIYDPNGLGGDEGGGGGGDTSTTSTSTTTTTTTTTTQPQNVCAGAPSPTMVACGQTISFNGNNCGRGTQCSGGKQCYAGGFCSEPNYCANNCNRYICELGGAGFDQCLRHSCVPTEALIMVQWCLGYNPDKQIWPGWENYPNAKQFCPRCEAHLNGD